MSAQRKQAQRERRRPKANRRETILLRLVNADEARGRRVFVAAEENTAQMLKDRGYRLGDVLTSEMWRATDPSLFRRAHSLGKLCVDNIDAFNGLNAHEALKKMQRDGNIECDVTLVVLANGIEAEARVAKSLAYEEMEGGAFRALYLRFCNHISERYWPELDCWQIEEMAELIDQAV